MKQVKVVQAKDSWVVIIEGTNEVIHQEDQKAYADASARAINRMLEEAYHEGYLRGSAKYGRGL